MAASSGHLVDDLEGAFQNCIAAIANQDHVSANDPDEVKTSVEQSIQKFLDVAKQLESFFLQKRCVLSVYKPEQIVKEDILELRSELMRKEILLQKHQERVGQWQAMLAHAHGANAASQQASSSGQQGAGQQQPVQQQQQQQQQQQMQQSVGQQHTGATGQPMPASNQPPPSQAMPPPSQNTYPGPGPLAYLEQTTSNIGMPERR